MTLSRCLGPTFRSRGAHSVRERLTDKSGKDALLRKTSRPADKNWKGALLRKTPLPLCAGTALGGSHAQAVSQRIFGVSREPPRVGILRKKPERPHVGTCENHSANLAEEGAYLRHSSSAQKKFRKDFVQDILNIALQENCRRIPTITANPMPGSVDHIFSSSRDTNRQLLWKQPITNDSGRKSGGTIENKLPENVSHHHGPGAVNQGNRFTLFIRLANSYESAPANHTSNAAGTNVYKNYY